VALLAAACSSGGDTADEAGPCTIKPGTVCRNEKLQGVSMVAADLRGADFSGADLSGADLRNADLTNAKFVKAQLGAVNFTGATLKGADLSGATVFFTNFSNANMSGVNKTGWYACNVTQPDGGFDAGECPTGAAAGSLVPAAPKPTGPPSVQYFRLEPPGKCLNDASGTGIEVEWSVKNVSAITFTVGGIRIDGGTVKEVGDTRLPFICDNKPHVVAMTAFGTSGRLVNSSFTASLRNTAPLAPPGG
jgi:uncharacterized protein YjbI with pentapeptide repeats